MNLLAIGVDVIMTDITRAGEESGNMERMKKIREGERKKEREKKRERKEVNIKGFGSNGFRITRGVIRGQDTIQ